MILVAIIIGYGRDRSQNYIDLIIGIGRLVRVAKRVVRKLREELLVLS